MKNPICLSPLKFYDDVTKQHYRKYYAYKHISPVITPLHIIPAFQFVLLSATATITSIYIKDVNDIAITQNILTDFTEAGLTIKNIDNYRVVMFCNQNAMLESLSEGYYYIEINFSDNISYYSEIFCFTNNLKGYLQLEYWNESNDLYIKNGIISFADNFKFKVYVRYLKEVIFQFEEEATELLGYSKIESQVSKKQYAFVTIAPEYLCDALRIVRLCDNKKITFENDEYELIAFEMEAKWQTQGDLAAVTCRFESDQVITNVTVENLAEYNDDFNLDFTI
jgi:hypothetical protein